MLDETNNKDALGKIIDIPIMDTFLDYTNIFSDNRFYHLLKASVCKKFIEEKSSMNKTFMDAGAGRGPYTKIAQGKYSKIYSFEYDNKELQHAINNVDCHDGSISFQQVDITKIPLNDNVIDVALCSEVLEHILDYKKAMAEIYRVMKPGGSLLFSMPNNHSLLYASSRIKRRKLLINLDNRHGKDKSWEQLRHYTFSYKKIESIAVGAGFKITKQYGAHVIRIPSKLRKWMMINSPLLLRVYININDYFGKKLPSFGSFYFLTLQK